MPKVRLMLEVGHRQEHLEVDRTDVLIGSDPDADLRIDHPSVSRHHGRLLVRRGRLVVVDHGSRMGIRCGDSLIKAPRAVRSGEIFEVGVVRISAWLRDPDDLDIVGETIDGFQVDAEVESVDDDIRRFKLSSKSEGEAELSLTGAPKTAEDVKAWMRRSERSANAKSAYVPALLATGVIDKRAYIIERIPPGIRLDRVTKQIQSSDLRLPIEAILSVVAQMVEATDALHATFGPHGAVEPRMISLGTEGSVSLLRPSPRPTGYEDPFRRRFLSAERRYGAAATCESDIWSLGQLSYVLTGDVVRQLVWLQRFDSIVAPMRANDPKDRPARLAGVVEALRVAASQAGLDPAQSHVGRIVRLLAADRGRPLATVRPSAPPE